MKVANAEVLTSTSIQLYTTILAASIYAITLYTAYATFLPTVLVTYFSRIPTIEPAHTAKPITLFPITLLLGNAARLFIFSSAVATLETKKAVFNTKAASLGEHLWYNVWGFSLRTKVVIKRTFALMLVSGVNTFVNTFITIEGVEAKGAIGYSVLCLVSNCIVGGALGIVAAV